MNRRLPPAAQQLRLASIRARRERLNQKFIHVWRAVAPGVTLEAEAVLFPTHPWAYDFAHRVARVAVEVQGGIWMAKGAHNTGTAVLRDTRKARFALLRGWLVFQVCSEDITIETVSEIAQCIRTRAIQLADPYQVVR